MDSLIFFRNRHTFTICNFILSQTYSKFILVNITVLDLSHIFLGLQFKQAFGLTKSQYWTVCAVNFRGHIVILVSGDLMFKFSKQFIQYISLAERGFDILRFEYWILFFMVPGFLVIFKDCTNHVFGISSLVFSLC